MFYAFSIWLTAAILDLEVKMTSYPNLNPSNGFTITILVKNDSLLVRISHWIPKILKFTFFKMAAGGHFGFSAVTRVCQCSEFSTQVILVEQ